MQKPRAYTIPGLTVSLVREPGVRLAERPQLSHPATAARVLGEYIGEQDREHFVVALLSVRNRVLGINTVSIGCLTASVVHPRLCWATHKRGYVAAAVMWPSGLKSRRGLRQ